MFPDSKIVALCDFETTGLDPLTEFPIEVAILFVNPRLEILRSYESLILPPDGIDVEASLSALMVNKIMPRDVLEHGENCANVADEIQRLCKEVSKRGKKDVVLCSDNAPFDRGFMKRLFWLGDNDDWPFHYNSYDTDFLLEATDVGDPRPAHRAMADVGLMYRALIKAQRRLGK